MSASSKAGHSKQPPSPFSPTTTTSYYYYQLPLLQLIEFEQVQEVGNLMTVGNTSIILAWVSVEIWTVEENKAQNTKHKRAISSPILISHERKACTPEPPLPLTPQSYKPHSPINSKHHTTPLTQFQNLQTSILAGEPAAPQFQLGSRTEVWRRLSRDQNW